MTREEKIQRIVDLLHEADGLQQEIAPRSDSESFCYQTHNQLTNLADTFEGMLDD